MALRALLHRLYEYFALAFGLGLLGVITLTWSLLSVPLYYLLPKRWAVPLGRRTARRRAVRHDRQGSPGK